jgi:hypothetical protein
MVEFIDDYIKRWAKSGGLVEVEEKVWMGGSKLKNRSGLGTRLAAMQRQSVRDKPPIFFCGFMFRKGNNKSPLLSMRDQWNHVGFQGRRIAAQANKFYVYAICYSAVPSTRLSQARHDCRYSAWYILGICHACWISSDPRNDNCQHTSNPVLKFHCGLWGV